MVIVLYDVYILILDRLSIEVTPTKKKLLSVLKMWSYGNVVVPVPCYSGTPWGYALK